MIDLPTWIWIDSSGVRSIGFPSTGDWSNKINLSYKKLQSDIFHNRNEFKSKIKQAIYIYIYNQKAHIFEMGWVWAAKVLVCQPNKSFYLEVGKENAWDSEDFNSKQLACAIISAGVP